MDGVLSILPLGAGEDVAERPWSRLGRAILSIKLPVLLWDEPASNKTEFPPCVTGVGDRDEGFPAHSIAENGLPAVPRAREDSQFSDDFIRRANGLFCSIPYDLVILMAF